jgi:hypothetical protein
MIANKRKSDTKKAQTKVFLGKWFYLITGGIFAYLASIVFPAKKTLFFIFGGLKDLHDYINESTLLTALIVPIVLTILTSYFKEYFKEKFSKK